MYNPPDNKLAFDYENGFYLTCDPSRIGKFLAHLELFKMTANTFGSIVECGVFKGVSLTRFAMFRSLFGPEEAKKIIGFDVFGEFPETKFDGDIQPREKFIDAAGACGIDSEVLMDVLEKKGCSANIELVAGDICKTVPEYLEKNPDLKISLLHLDVDIYEPSKTVMDYLFPRLVKGGILIIDDYERFPGETKAVDDALMNSGYTIEKFSFCAAPCYVKKN